MTTQMKDIKELENDLTNKIHHSKSLSLIKKSVDDFGINIKTLSEKVFSKPTKKSRKWLMEILSKDSTKSIGWIHIVRILNKSNKIDQDIVFNELSKTEEEKLNSSDLQSKLIKLLSKNYNDQRLTKLLIHSDYEQIKDITYMLEDIKEKKDLEFLPKKPKNLNQIHKVCERMSIKLSCNDYDLEQREDILALDGVDIENDMTIRVPRTHYDLIDLGEDLSFCIGNGFYSREVKRQACSIVSIYKKSKPLYGVQFNRYSIKQAYGFDNESIPNEVLLKIQNALISAPEVPKDFIAISDSTWIQGYKYNNKDLYLLLNHQIYVYFDVEQDVYEELIQSDRKGTYVNKIIKSNYKYEKIT